MKTIEEQLEAAQQEILRLSIQYDELEDDTGADRKLLEEAKGLLRDAPIWLREPPDAYASDGIAQTVAWLKRVAALLAGAGAKRDDPDGCPAGCVCVGCTWERQNQPELADERAGGERRGLNTVLILLRGRITDLRDNGENFCQQVAPGPNWATEHAENVKAAYDAAANAIERVLHAIEGTAPPVAKQAEGRPEWADDVTIEDIALRLDAGWPNLERGGMRARAESLRRLLAHTKRLESYKAVAIPGLSSENAALRERAKAAEKRVAELGEHSERMREAVEAGIKLRDDGAKRIADLEQTLEQVVTELLRIEWNTNDPSASGWAAGALGLLRRHQSFDEYIASQTAVKADGRS